MNLLPLLALSEAATTASFAGTGLSTDSGAFVASMGTATAAFGAFEALPEGIESASA